VPGCHKFNLTAAGDACDALTCRHVAVLVERQGVGCGRHVAAGRQTSLSRVEECSAFY
jgi:hypothetical protein